MSDVFVIITGVLAVIAYVQFGLRRFRQRVRLERTLKRVMDQPRPAGDEGKRTILHLVAELGMSEAEIMDAAFRSKSIKRVKIADPRTKKTVAIMLQFKQDRSAPSLSEEEAAQTP